ncbi:DMT family transporter [Virgibacillus xinjiangensis]|uniref:DMT family transporter n=1 Tax=Virgibacillus xinjiangensis TaxID=393090 RepID=A0ABV7CY83_9BACI
MKGLLLLAITIISEVFASTMLKLSEGFTNPLPTIGVILGFLNAFVFLSLTLKSMQLSTAYAAWSGVGTALISIVGVVLFQEHFNAVKLAGLLFVITGIVLLSLSEEKAQAADHASAKSR